MFLPTGVTVMLLIAGAETISTLISGGADILDILSLQGPGDQSILTFPAIYLDEDVQLVKQVEDEQDEPDADGDFENVHSFFLLGI